MLKQNIEVRVLAIFIVTIFLFTGATVLLSGNANAWDADVASGPTTVTAGSTVDFEIQITNTGSKSMKINYVGIHFDWMDEGYYYSSGDVSNDNPYVLGSGDSATFYINGVPIPNGITTNTYHSGEVLIYAADPGVINEWGSPYSQSYSGSVFVEESISPADGGSEGGGSGGNPSSGGINWPAVILALALLILAIGVVIAMILQSSKKKNVPSPSPVPPPPVGEINQEIQSNTKFCPYCGREIPADAKICPYCGHKME